MTRARVQRWTTALLLALTLAPSAPAAVTGDEVRQSMRRAIKYITSQQRPGGAWPEHSYPGGVTCLATLALLQSGEKPDSDTLQPALVLIRRMPDVHTYVVSLKIMALAAADAKAYQPEIQAAATWLIKAQGDAGLWNYTEQGNRFDHSNTQFALLGLHTAAQTGVKVPNAVWRKAQQALLRNQNPDGGWAYQGAGASYGSMTAAGLASLVILGATVEQGQEHAFTGGAAPNCGQYRTAKPLAKALEWLGNNFQAGSNPIRGDFTLYWLYAVERCGILSGQRYFGKHDWYREGAAVLVGSQTAGGSWNDSIADTCFGLLFLAKGHKPLAVQKLQWSADDAWNPDRRDLEHLVSFVGDALGEPVAWQTVTFEAPLEDWLAAPLLYVSGHTFPKWDANQRAKVRSYIEQGGTILAEACCGRPEFRAGFESFVATTFPEVPLRKLGREHAVFHLLHELDDSHPLLGLDFGCRTSVLYSPDDLSCLWEQAKVPQLSERAFQLGANVLAYAAGRRPLRDRLDAVVLPKQGAQAEPNTPPAQDALRLAQVVYDGDWRPFPHALSNLAQFVRSQLGLDVVPQARQVRLADPALYTCPVLVLAGHFEPKLTDDEVRALVAHLRRGGFLIADACCGTEPFDTGFRRLMTGAFPDATLEKLPADHPLFTGKPGFNVTRVGFSPDVARLKPGLSEPELWGLRIDGRLAAVYSPYSLSCGLGGPVFEGCWGYTTEDARRIAANIVLYALTH